ncbi:MAG: hypothetical protein Q9M36_04265 [Sulfurovum sp.]|nr:hypothetical protein [Sulfurovum sp.]
MLIFSAFIGKCVVVWEDAWKPVFFTQSHIKKTWIPYAVSLTIYLNLDKGTYKLIADKQANQIASSIKIQQQVIRNNYLIPLIIVLLLVLWLPYVAGNGKIMKVVFLVIPAVIFYMLFGLSALLIFGTFGIYYYFKKKEDA